MFYVWVLGDDVKNLIKISQKNHEIERLEGQLPSEHCTEQIVLSYILSSGIQMLTPTPFKYSMCGVPIPTTYHLPTYTYEVCIEDR